MNKVKTFLWNVLKFLSHNKPFWNYDVILMINYRVSLVTVDRGFSLRWSPVKLVDLIQVKSPFFGIVNKPGKNSFNYAAMGVWVFHSWKILRLVFFYFFSSKTVMIFNNTITAKLIVYYNKKLKKRKSQLGWTKNSMSWSESVKNLLKNLF